jgi:phosphoribosylaminoimidazole (AIR) synthetase
MYMMCCNSTELKNSAVSVNRSMMNNVALFRKVGDGCRIKFAMMWSVFHCEVGLFVVLPE